MKNNNNEKMTDVIAVILALLIMATFFVKILTELYWTIYE